MINKPSTKPTLQWFHHYNWKLSTFKKNNWKPSTF